MKKILLFAVLILLTAVSQYSFADDDTTLVPLNSIEAPATDLVYQGKAIDQDQAVSLRKRGVDLSALDPQPNDSWGLPLANPPEALPADGATLDYDSDMGMFHHEISIHRVTLGELPYRLYIGTVPHRALLTRALLARLGYNQYPLQRYSSLTIRFPSLQDRANFLDAVSFDIAVADPSAWVKDQPANDPVVTLQDVVLEPGRVDLKNFSWALLPSNFSGGRRALRALLAPISLCDAPENIDSYHWDFDRILNNSLLIPYPREIERQRPFDDSTIDDIRWIARKIGALTLDDWKAIVAAAEYPADISAFVLQKILARRNQMLTSMNLPGAPLPYDPHFTNASIKNGQVIQAKFPGYASRFTYGDAEDPMSAKQLFDFGLMEGISSGMDTLAGLLNQKMVIAGAQQYADAHQQQVIGDYIQHIAQHPGEPYTQPISTWGGPVGSFSLTADRQLTTGSFYGSNAAIQLVDTVGITGSAGYVLGVDGIQKVSPAFQGTLSVGRNYTHLRTLTSISDAFKVSAFDFVIPKLLADLSHILGTPKPLATPEEKAKALKDYTKAVEDLLSNIRDGEMFTITDSLMGGIGGKVQVPVQALFPTAPVGYDQGISFGAQVQGVILGRTTFSRVNDPISGNNYLQIYVQSVDTMTGNISFDFNYFISLAHIEANKSVGIARSRVYSISNDPDRPQETSQILANSVRDLLRWNNDSALRKNYPYYALKHDLNESDWQTRFLFFQIKNMEERHSLRIDPPSDPDHPFKPEDFERSFYAYRKLDLTGLNFIAPIADIIGALTGGVGQFANGSGSNPAYTPFGSAHWTEFYSDAELTEGKDFTPVTIAKETWAGWSISQRNLTKIFDAIDRKLSDLRNFGLQISPIHRDTFASTKNLEFYRVNSNTIFYPVGMNRILSQIEPEGTPTNYNPSFWERLFADSFSPTDKAAFDALVNWVGGKKAYEAMCLEDWRQQNLGPDGRKREDPPPPSGRWKGNNYSCVDSWATEVLNFRRTRPNPADKKTMVEWQTKALALLEKKVPVLELLKTAGLDGFFFQVDVSGFRKGDHEARDSEQHEVIAHYVSDSVGTMDQYAGSGAFNDLASQTQIMPYEVNALFMSGGD